MKNKSIIQIIVFLTILLICIDQISKIIVKCNYVEPVGNSIIKIELVDNTGIAFGMNSGNTKNIILTLIVLMIIVSFVKNQKDIIDKKTAVALSFILSGGISNLIDRIYNGAVVDFIKLEKFATFNMADCYIVIGWILFIIFLIIFNKHFTEVENCEKK